MDDEERGIYNKFHVKRREDPKNKHGRCFYFVLDLDHDKYAIPALIAYANACKTTHRRLSMELMDMIHRMEDKVWET